MPCRRGPLTIRGRLEVGENTGPEGGGGGNGSNTTGLGGFGARGGGGGVLALGSGGGALRSARLGLRAKHLARGGPMLGRVRHTPTLGNIARTSRSAETRINLMLAQLVALQAEGDTPFTPRAQTAGCCDRGVKGAAIKKAVK